MPQREIPVDGLYRVASGDTLYGIAFEYGLDYREIARWNDIGSPYVIYPDQVLRLRPPPARQNRSGGTSIAAAPAPRAETRSDSRPRSEAKDGSGQSGSRKTPVAKTTSPTGPAPGAGGWRWPLDGRLVAGFEAGNPARKGVDIAGREGQPVLASAGGEVVYSGSGLIGYGELVIVKHDERMLSAYAHNRRRLVAEGEQVRGGQQIAELGRNGSNQPVLHFEIRRDGQPVNPLNYLPRR